METGTSRVASIPRGQIALVLGTSAVMGAWYGILLAVMLRSAQPFFTSLLGSFVFGGVCLGLWRTVFPWLAGRERAWLWQMMVAIAVISVVSFGLVAGPMYLDSGRWIFSPYTGGDRHVTIPAAAVGVVPLFLVILPVLPVALMTVLGFHLGWRRIQTLQERENTARQLASLAQLQALRAQINPHFLFNSLNSVAQLLRRDQEQAERCLHRLAEVFRYVLRSENKKFVTLGDEIEIADAYLDIERARFGDRLSVDFEVAPDARKRLVPTLILQPLVENAVKHGVSARSEGGHVRIAADVRGNVLEVEVSDTGVGMNGHRSVEGTGVGLKNVEQRLVQLYGDEFAPRIESQEGRGTRVVLRVPAQALTADG